MGNVVRIGGKDYKFVSVHGRQFINGREFSAIRDDDRSIIKISDSIPIETQLAQASRATTSILNDQRRLAELGLDVLPESPLDGIPMVNAPRNAEPLP